MDFELSDEQRAFAETARAFAREEWLPHAPGWDERGEFPVEALRRAAELGFAGIYVGDEFGGSGLGRVDATIIFEELAAACVSTAAYLSIHNMAAWMIDRFGSARTARAVSARADDDGAFRELLPDRARQRLGCCGARHPRRARRRRLRAQRDKSVHLGRLGQRHLCDDGAHRRRGAKGHLLPRRREGYPRPFLRQEGAKARLEHATDRDGDLRGLPRAGRQPARRGGRRLQDRDDGARRRAPQYLRLLAGRRARLPSKRRAIICSNGASSAGRSPISRRCSSSSPTWRPSSTRRG